MVQEELHIQHLIPAKSQPYDYEENLVIERGDSNPDVLVFACSDRFEQQSIDLTRDEVRRVRDYLSQWLIEGAD